jgi:hypothetical protein
MRNASGPAALEAAGARPTKDIHRISGSIWDADNALGRSYNPEGLSAIATLCAYGGMFANPILEHGSVILVGH